LKPDRQTTLTYILAGGAEGSMGIHKNESKRQKLNLAVIVATAIALISLAYTANLGGKIRHTELRADSSNNAIDLHPNHEKGNDND